MKRGENELPRSRGQLSILCLPCSREQASLALMASFIRHLTIALLK
jgi:hypothetical protein